MSGQGRGEAVFPEGVVASDSEGVDSNPKVGIVITHYNYSSFIENALRSLVKQSYENIEVVVVDDCSKAEERAKLEDILSKYEAFQFRAVWLEENVGQLHAFYKGVEQLDADFYCMLDPDDSYFPTFVEEMVGLHLSPQVYVSMICCDQVFTRNGRRVTGTNLKKKNFREFPVVAESTYAAEYYGSADGQWPWTSTSSMMFRRDAIQFLWPTHGTSAKICADAYLATGARYLGGTLVFMKALVNRSVHEDAAFNSDRIVSIFTKSSKIAAKDIINDLMLLALVNLVENKAHHLTGRKHFKKIIRDEYSFTALSKLRRKHRHMAGLISTFDMISTLFRGVRKAYRKHLKRKGRSRYV